METPALSTYGQTVAGADGRGLGGRRAPGAARAPGGGLRPDARAGRHGGRPRGGARPPPLGPGDRRLQHAALQRHRRPRDAATAGTRRPVHLRVRHDHRRARGRRHEGGRSRLRHQGAAQAPAPGDRARAARGAGTRHAARDRGELRDAGRARARRDLPLEPGGPVPLGECRRRADAGIRDRRPGADARHGAGCVRRCRGAAATGGAGYLQRPAIRQRRGDVEASRRPPADRATQRARRTQCGGAGRLLRNLRPGRDRPAPPAAAGVAVAKDGSRRAVGRRGRARLQQPAHRDHELLGPPAGRPGPG